MIFPTLAAVPGAYVNLDAYYRAHWMPRHGYPSPPACSPVLDPEVCESMVREHWQEFGLGWSYGGWGEDRSGMWRGSYLDQEKKYIHLGVDFNAPAGTPVAADFVAEVLAIDTDDPLKGGWGTKVAMKVAGSDVVLVYAHLDPKVDCKPGELLAARTIFGRVGNSECNGCWYPHMHAQSMTLATYEECAAKPEEFDGYCCASDMQKCMKKFHDPLPFVRLR